MTGPSSGPASTKGFVTTAAALAVVFVVTWLLQTDSARTGSAWWAGQARNASLLWHQDWRVFTRAPTGPETVAYDAQHLTAITMYATGSGNRRGLSRIAYSQWMETAALEQVVPEQAWRECAADVVERCRPVPASVPAVAVANPTHDATVCGRVVLAREFPLNWRDADPAAGRTRRVGAVALLDVACGR